MKKILIIVVLLMPFVCFGQQRINIDTLTTAYDLTQKIFHALEDSISGDYGTFIKQQKFNKSVIVISRDSLEGSVYYVNYFNKKKKWYSFSVSPETSDLIKVKNIKRNKRGQESRIWLLLDEMMEIVNSCKTREQYQIDSLMLINYETIKLKKVEKDVVVGEQEYSYFRHDTALEITDYIIINWYNNKLMGDIRSLDFRPSKDTVFDIFVDMERNYYDCDYVCKDKKNKISYNEIIKVLRRALIYIENIPD